MSYNNTNTDILVVCPCPSIPLHLLLPTELNEAGAFAAFTIDLLVYPLDTIKTRIQSPDYKRLYTNPSTGTVNRALFRGLYQGIGSVIIATVPSCIIQTPFLNALPDNSLHLTALSLSSQQEHFSPPTRAPNPSFTGSTPSFHTKPPHSSLFPFFTPSLPPPPS